MYFSLPVLITNIRTLSKHLSGIMIDQNTSKRKLTTRIEFVIGFGNRFRFLSGGDEVVQGDIPEARRREISEISGRCEKSGKTKIAAGALLPHEIIGELDGGQVAELQWKRVDDLRKKGSLTHCIAISDVSGSMDGTPMEVSVALGVLVSELSEEPWRGKLITFSDNPELQSVEGDDLRSNTKFVRSMEWGMNTDFQKVFDLILRVAVEGKLKVEEMIKRVFVFSDMEFDEASSSKELLE